jgi:hypothetical protein
VVVVEGDDTSSLAPEVGKLIGIDKKPLGKPADTLLLEQLCPKGPSCCLWRRMNTPVVEASLLLRHNTLLVHHIVEHKRMLQVRAPLQLRSVVV